MDFTREPIIETVITPKEGCKLVVRSSKSSGQEEYFVDAVEVVSFGQSFFFRSLERPKAFLVPVSDYEILEVRETRMVLKNVGLDRSIKIAGGREAPMRGGREPQTEKTEPPVEEQPAAEPAEAASEGRVDKKRDRHRRYRRRKGREGTSPTDETPEAPKEGEERIEIPEPRKTVEGEETPTPAAITTTTTILSSLLPPPPNLISETIARYKDNVLFKGAFYTKEEEAAAQAQAEGIVAEQPSYGNFELSEEEEEEIYQQRKQQQGHNEEENEDQPPFTPPETTENSPSEDEIRNGNSNP